MKTEHENFIKINEFNYRKMMIEEEDENESDDISFAIEEKIDYKLSNIFEKRELGNCLLFK
jgi:hypothetical protein